MPPLTVVCEGNKNHFSVGSSGDRISCYNGRHETPTDSTAVAVSQVHRCNTGVTCCRCNTGELHVQS